MNPTYTAIYVSRSDVFVLMENGVPVATGRDAREAYRNFFASDTVDIEVDMTAFREAVNFALIDKLKISAIKEMRHAFGPRRLGLKQAKEMVEMIQEVADRASGLLQQQKSRNYNF